MDRVVKQVHFAEGDIVPEKSLLMEIEAKTEWWLIEVQMFIVWIV